MRNSAWMLAMLLSLSLFPVALSAAESRMDSQTRQRVGALDSALDELKNNHFDTMPEQRSGRGERLNQAFVALTGEAVNPLFGVTALGMYRYFSTPEYLRDSLPVYDQPMIWIPLLCIILLMLFNSTICEAIPPLKVPLNALGDIVNKAGAVVVLPLVVKMFADQVAQPAAREMAGLYNTMFSVAYAGETAAGSGVWLSLGWLGGALVGVIVYGAVWLTFNVVDVLILLCPFPGIDALLKSFRLAVVGLLMGTNQWAPTASFFLAAIVVVISLFAAGWSFRLSVFGLVYSTDILFFRKADVAEDVGGFSCPTLKQRHGIPLRTWGRLGKNAAGELSFTYRPWLVLARREATLGKEDGFEIGRGLLNPSLAAEGTPWLSLPPRYRGREGKVAEKFGVRRVVDCGMRGALGSLWMQLFGERRTGEAAA